MKRKGKYLSIDTPQKKKKVSEENLEFLKH